MKKAMLISCFNWYEKRLQVIRERLISRGYEVVVLLSDFDHITKAPIEKRYEECTYLSVSPYAKNLSLARIKSHFAFGKAVAQSLEEYAPNLVYALVPPNNVARACLAYKDKHPDLVYLVDVIDLWPESMPLKFLKQSFLARKWAEMRNASLKVADGVVLECDLYRKSLPLDSGLCPNQTLRLFSDYSQEELLLAKEVADQQTFDPLLKTINFAYVGSLNSITDYDGILAIVKAFITKGWQVVFHIIGEGQKREGFLSDLTSSGCQVYYHGMIFDKPSKIKLVAGCDFAFNMMIDQVTVGLTMKSLDYLSMGLPMINSIKGDTWDIIETHGIGINYEGQPDRVVSVCQKLDYRNMRAKAWEVLMSQFTREAFEDQVKQFLTAVLDKGDRCV